jgi:hypothetical protein
MGVDYAMNGETALSLNGLGAPRALKSFVEMEFYERSRASEGRGIPKQSFGKGRAFPNEEL